MTPLIALLLLAAAPPQTQQTVPGTLVIVGGGKLPASVQEAFFAAAGGKDKAAIVVVPTASVDADDPKQSASFTDRWAKLGAKSVTLLHTRDRKVADTAAFTTPLKDATAVWFSGGDQNKLIAAYRGTATETAIKDVLARGGAVGGTSAGAAVMSDLMIQGSKGDLAEVGPGFGFLPGVVVDQHFVARKRLPRLKGVLDTHPGFAGLGIDEATAVVVTGRRIQVVGDSTVTAVWAKSTTRPVREDVLKAGDQLDLYQIRRAALARAEATPFPPAKAADPVVPKGSLLIGGGGGLPADVWEKFVALSGGPDAQIVYVATAGEDPISADPGEAKLLRRHGAKNVAVLHTRDPKVADDPKFSEVLTKAGGVWFGGGRQWKFVDAYAGTLTEKRFREVLARGGCVGGSSAGASIQAEYMPRGHPLGNTVMMAEGYERGFGYLPGVAIDQHFFARKRTKDMTALMTAFPQLLGIGIDEGTALVVTGGVAEVVGKTQAAFYDWRQKPAGEVDYLAVPAGKKFDLVKRRVVE